MAGVAARLRRKGQDADDEEEIEELRTTHAEVQLMIRECVQDLETAVVASLLLVYHG